MSTEWPVGVPDERRWAEVELVAFDFDGVFTDNTVYVDENGREAVRCWRSDGLGLARLREMGIKLVIVSTEINPVVSARALKLKVECRQAIEDKGLTLEDILREAGITPEKAVFVGNDINDLSAFRVVGLPVAVADAYPEILDHVTHRLQRPGGWGAVRELCDIIFLAKTRRDGRSTDGPFVYAK